MHDNFLCTYCVLSPGLGTGMHRDIMMGKKGPAGSLQADSIEEEPGHLWAFQQTRLTGKPDLLGNY